MSVTVHMGKCICPNGHLLIGSAVKSEDATEDELMDQFGVCVALALSSGQMNPTCSICGARAESWRMEITKIDALTLEAAVRILSEIGEEQKRIRAIAKRQNSSCN